MRIDCGAVIASLPLKAYLLTTALPILLRDLMRLSPHFVLPLALLVLGLIAAPFYGRVMENMLWMGETLRALCGF